MKLGEKIKYLRKSKGISQEELATMLKINRNFLSRIETGKSDPNAGILKSIAQIFNVDLNSLLDINNSEEQGIDKIKYITENCKYLQDKDLEFIVRRERFYGEVKRSFYIGEKKESDIKANYENGILTISFPKEEAPKKEIPNITIK